MKRCTCTLPVTGVTGVTGVTATLMAGVVTLAFMLAFPAGAAAQAQPSWLDLPPVRWNAPGAPVPAAAPPNVPPQAQCVAGERPPQTGDESQLVAAGWRLLQAWPLRQATVVLEGRAVPAGVLLATAGYDGMCRPYNFNAFVFVAGQFAGTFAPAPMVSRTDGVLAGAPSALPAGHFQADFTRYAPTDPLCCPSLGHTRVTYALERLPAGWVLAPESIRPALALPATGGHSLPLRSLTGLAACAIAVGVGLGYSRHSRA